MLTQERLDALHAVDAGTVSACMVNAPGTPIRYEPKEKQVSIGFLMKAGLVQRDGKTVELTERGERYIAATRTAPKPSTSRKP